MMDAEREMRPTPRPTKCGTHLTEPEEIKGFPTFPEGTKSLLSKHLTQAVWDECKDMTDEHGTSFKRCILSGCQNVDSGIGCYASSHQSYNQFASLFDPIILEYHGHEKSAKHVSDMDWKNLDCPPFDAKDAKMIKSTRIRVGRNLAAYPLGPGITRDQRNEVEKAAQVAFKAFEGELEGTYYPLNGMDAATQKQLIEDHFLFKEGDRFLEACGLNRDWPEGRGIFHTPSKEFLVWVNEEDEFRIISMQQGADILAVFRRLSNACATIGKVAEFAHDEHLGYITSCPTNLGTALRASVHIHLPYLGKQKDQFKTIADKFHVQIRGAHGEHTETDDHIYDISNIRRLGLSEVSLVQDMYNGVKAMIEAEKALAPKEAEWTVEETAAEPEDAKVEKAEDAPAEVPMASSEPVKADAPAQAVESEVP